ncbi:hypothetical protein CEXT_180051 [Caerostris extrusa]|uniref:Uncharacterized protein n=1 Tax=Caerostris extrusa TaxID=172846 RepID=A0AAV4PGD1_CAEEX|nr:hypothetical protein CEXT_180051 [Caerostris extrusa]
MQCGSGNDDAVPNVNDDFGGIDIERTGIFLICLVGSAQASPDYLRMILANYLSNTQDMETNSPSDNLMDLRRDGFISYELKYRSRDPAGLHFRQEYSDGSGLIKGILNLKDEKGDEK